MSNILALDQRGTEAALDEDAGDADEQRQQSHRAELLRRQQPCKNDRDRKAQTLPEYDIERAP